MDKDLNSGLSTAVLLGLAGFTIDHLGARLGLPLIFFFSYIAVFLACFLPGRLPGFLTLSTSAALAAAAHVYTRSGYSLWTESLTLIAFVAVGSTAILLVDRLKKERDFQKALLHHGKAALILVSKENLELIFTNEAFERMFGYGPGELIGRHVSILNAPAGVEPEEKAREIIAVLERSGFWSGEIENARKDGTTFWCEASVIDYDHPSFGACWMTIHTEISERRRVEEDLRKTENRYRAAIEAYLGSVVLLESVRDAATGDIVDLVIHDSNQAARRQYGENRTLTGRSIRNGPFDFCPALFERCRQVAETGQALDDEFALATENGGMRWLSRQIVPVTDGVALFIRDITDRKQEREELERLLDRLEIAARAGGFGVWDLDIENNTLVWDEQMYALYGMRPQDFSGAYEAWQAALHPEDREASSQAVQAAIEGTGGDGIEFRVNHPDGTTRNILAHWIVNRDEEGRAYRMTGLNYDITDRKQGEELLIRAREEAQAGSRARDELLARVSHEIRTPMNGVLGIADLLLKDELAPRHEYYIRTIFESARALLGQIDQILDFSRIQVGKIRTAPRTEFCPAALIRDRSAPLQIEAAGKNLAFDLRIADGLPASLVGNPDCVGQVLTILLDNAIKFTDTGGVEACLECEPGSGGQYRLHFAVRDSGIGIPLEFQERIFESFMQADNSIARKYRGTGLGLAIAKNLVESMGGQIQVKSAPGEGSEFRFCLELAAPAGGQPGVEPAASSRNPPPGRRVLVVEDNPVNQMLLMAMLRKMELECEGVENGKAALETLEAKAERYDLIFMDLHMPGMDGLKTTAIIRQSARPGLRTVPIVGITADSRDEIFGRCRSAGMNEVLIKPVTFDQVRKVTAKMLATRIPAQIEVG